MDVTGSGLLTGRNKPFVRELGTRLRFDSTVLRMHAGLAQRVGHLRICRGNLPVVRAVENHPNPWVEPPVFKKTCNSVRLSADK